MQGLGKRDKKSYLPRFEGEKNAYAKAMRRVLKKNLEIRGGSFAAPKNHMDFLIIRDKLGC